CRARDRRTSTRTARSSSERTTGSSASPAHGTRGGRVVLVNRTDRRARRRAGAPELEAGGRIGDRERRPGERVGAEGDDENFARVRERVNVAGPEREAEDVGAADRSPVFRHRAGGRIDLDEAIGAPGAFDRDVGLAAFRADDVAARDEAVSE